MTWYTPQVRHSPQVRHPPRSDTLSPSPMSDTHPPGQTPPPQVRHSPRSDTPQVRHPPRTHTPGSMSERYASYWNAFLFGEKFMPDKFPVWMDPKVTESLLSHNNINIKVWRISLLWIVKDIYDLCWVQLFFFISGNGWHPRWSTTFSN